MMIVGGAVNNAGLTTTLLALRTGLAKITELKGQKHRSRAMGARQPIQPRAREQ